MRYSVPTFVMFAFLLLTAPAQATVKIALRNGGSCSTCHINPAGGGLRNDYGFSEIMLRDLPRPRPAGEGHMSTQLTPRVRWGADLRIQGMRFDSLTVIRPMSVDMSTPADTATRAPSAVIFPMQAALYLNARTTDRIDVSVTHFLLQSATEFWVRYTSAMEQFYVRAGRFLPAYGLRLDDHTAFIRGGHGAKGGLPFQMGMVKQGLPFGPYMHGSGSIEGGLYWRDIHASAHLSTPTFGTQARSFTEMQYGGRVEWQSFIASSTHMVVASYLKEGDINFKGLSYGLQAGPAVILFEVDWATNWARGFGVVLDDPLVSRADYVEIDYQLKQGISLQARYERFVQNSDLETGKLDRFVIGAEYFPVPFIEIKPQIRFDGSEFHEKQTVNFIMQLHAFF